MPHILRGPDGRIQSVHREPQPGSELLAANAPELRAFLGEDAEAGGTDFSQLDAGFIRVIEDLVDVLVARNVIRITDLPLEAQHKLFDRKGFRDKARSRALRLFGDMPGDDGGDGSSLLGPTDTL